LIYIILDVSNFSSSKNFLSHFRIIGGMTDTGGDGITAVEEYDPELDKWTKKSDMPTKRAYPAVSVVNGKIYVIG